MLQCHIQCIQPPQVARQGEGFIAVEQCPVRGAQAAQRLLGMDAPAVCQIDDGLKVHVHIFFDAALQPRIAQPRQQHHERHGVIQQQGRRLLRGHLHHSHQRQGQHLLVHVLRQLLHQRQHSVRVWQLEHPHIAPHAHALQTLPARGNVVSFVFEQ